MATDNSPKCNDRETRDPAHRRSDLRTEAGFILKWHPPAGNFGAGNDDADSGNVRRFHGFRSGPLWRLTVPLQATRRTTGLGSTDRAWLPTPEPKTGRNVNHFIHLTDSRVNANNSAPALLFTVITCTGPALSTPAFSQVDPTKMVDAFERVGGKFEGFRRSGAKGICAVGEFVGNAQGRALSTSSAFSGKPVAVVARFSVGSANPRRPITPRASATWHCNSTYLEMKPGR